jgi:hypothetical protein
MTNEIDVYREWLGIPDTDRPLNYYQLLRVKKFSDDTGRIREHYRKMNAHVRKYATGDFARRSQELLNELARAMLTLTDAQRKRDYDASLGRKDKVGFRRRGLDEVLLTRKVIDQNQLAKARQFADAVGLELREAVVQQKMAPADVAAQAYAESEGLPYVELTDIGVAEDLVPKVPPRLARQHNCVPVMVDDGTLLMASPYPLSPDVEQELRLRCGLPVRTVITTGTGVQRAVEEHFPRDAAEPAEADQPAGTETPTQYVSPAEKMKKHAMVGIVGFNLGVILTVMAFTLLAGSVGLGGIIVAILLGLIGGGGAFGVAMMMDK